MTRRILSTLACASLALAGGAANATASASATLGQLTVRLVDLNPADGLAPSITFDAGYGSQSVATVQVGNGPSAYDGHFTATPFADVSATVGDAGDSASGAITGELQGNGGQASARTSVTSDRATGTAYTLFGDLDAGFTLGPGTLLVITATADVTATETGGLGNWADAIASLQLHGVLGPSSQDSAASLLVEVGDNGVDGLHAQQGEDSSFLYVALANPSLTDDERGTFHGWVQADATSRDALPQVPEPASLLLVGSGLALLALRRQPRP